MNVLILGGGSPRHQMWVRQVAEAAQPHFEQVQFLDYAHWASGAANVDILHEIEQASILAAIFNGNYVIIAKSIGTFITTLGVASAKLHPTRCILLGFPLSMVEQFPAIAPALPYLPLTTCLSNTHDPLGSAHDVAAYMRVHRNAQLRVSETPGDTHDYLDFTRIIDLALNRSV